MLLTQIERFGGPYEELGSLYDGIYKKGGRDFFKIIFLSNRFKA